MAILIIIAQNLEEGDSRGDFLICSTLFFVVFFALGNGSIPWLIVGEMFTQGEAENIISLGPLSPQLLLSQRTIT